MISTLRRTLVAVGASFFFASAMAATPDAFKAANQAYESGDIAAALQGYRALADQGYEGAALYFNMGNAYYKSGSRGNAVLWYERALRLAPRDADIRFNLSLARSHLKEDVPLLDRLVSGLSVSSIAVLASFFLWWVAAMAGLLLMARIKRATWTDIVLAVGVAGLAFTTLWLGAAVALDSRATAIVVTQQSEVRNGPGPDYGVGFTIPEGSRVEVLSRRPDWTQVGLSQQGLKGWLPAQDIELINRRATAP